MLEHCEFERFVNSIMATSTSIKVNSVMAMSTSINGRRQVSWKKVQTCLHLIFVHVDKSSIRRAKQTKTRRTVQNAEINFRKHLCNVADDARPVQSRSADQNHILIAVVARELHGDVLPAELTFCVLGAQIHLPTPVSQHSGETVGDVPPLKNTSLVA